MPINIKWKLAEFAWCLCYVPAHRSCMLPSHCSCPLRSLSLLSSTGCSGSLSLPLSRFFPPVTSHIFPLLISCTCGRTYWGFQWRKNWVSGSFPYWPKGIFPTPSWLRTPFRIASCQSSCTAICSCFWIYFYDRGRSFCNLRMYHSHTFSDTNGK